MLGHAEIAERFRRAIIRNRLAAAYLFVGPPGVGKRLFAENFARALLCLDSPGPLAACGSCDACRQYDAGTHPDMLSVAKPADRMNIPVELLIGDRDHRMQSGVAHHMGMTPYFGRHRIAIIDDADDLNEEGANCLLKILEEPPRRSVLVLVGTVEQTQLPTIRSRCQVIRFGRLMDSQVASLLSQSTEISVDDANRIAMASRGSLAHAARLADPEFWALRENLLSVLGRYPLEPWKLIALVWTFVEQSGTDTSGRRIRLRSALQFATEFLLAVVRAACGANAGSDPSLEGAAETASSRWPDAATTAAECALRTLDALEHVDRNANLNSLLDAWAKSLPVLQRA